MDRAVEDLRVRHDREGLSPAEWIGDDGREHAPPDPLAAELDPAPTLFAREVQARPALPWDQAAAAGLDARMNAPLPLDQLAFQLKRLDRWKPGTIGRYAAVYARHEDVRDGLIATAYLDGVAVPVRFPSPQLRRRQTRLLAVIAAVTAITTFLAIATTASVLSARAEAAARIAALESEVAIRLRQQRAAENASAKIQALANAGLDGRRGTAVVADMDWAAAARSPNARIEVFHRDGTLIAVEVRGEEAPYTGANRTVQRSSKPLRRGVWLWGSDGDRQVDGGQP